MKHSSYKDKVSLQQLHENSVQCIINDFNYFYLSFHLPNLIEKSVKILESSITFHGLFS